MRSGVVNLTNMAIVPYFKSDFNRKSYSKCHIISPIVETCQPEAKNICPGLPDE